MKVTINALRPVAVWKWDTSQEPHKLYHYGNGGMMDDEDEDEECGICRLAFESCCPACKMPGDDCPLSTSADVLQNYSSHQFGAHARTSFTCTAC